MIDLRQGDCLELLKDIPGGSIDAVICDPPYGTTSCKWDSVIDFDLMWAELKRVIKPNGAIALFGAEPFSSALRMSNIKQFKYDWVYKKVQGTGHLNAKKQPLRIYELVSVFYAKQPTYNPQKKPSGKRNKGVTRSNKKDIDDSVYRKGITGNTEWVDDGLRYPVNIIDDVWDKERFNTTKRSQEHRHPTKKPVSLMEYLVKTYTNEGDTVLDFTMGSGSTGVACVNTNRKFIGFELDPDYFKIAQERINQALTDKEIA